MLDWELGELGAGQVLDTPVQIQGGPLKPHLNLASHRGGICCLLRYIHVTCSSCRHIVQSFLHIM